jgi:hypothetical protein
MKANDEPYFYSINPHAENISLNAGTIRYDNPISYKIYTHFRNRKEYKVDFYSAKYYWLVR